MPNHFYPRLIHVNYDSESYSFSITVTQFGTGVLILYCLLLMTRMHIEIEEIYRERYVIGKSNGNLPITDLVEIYEENFQVLSSLVRY